MTDYDAPCSRCHHQFRHHAVTVDGYRCRACRCKRGYWKPAVVLAAVLVLMVGAAPVQAAPLPDMTFRYTQLPAIYREVEQQPGVVNTTGCLWDPDDLIAGMFSGVLEAGESVTHTECVVTDWQAHLVAVDAGGSLRATVSTGGLSSATCLLTTEHDANAPLPPVEGTTGVGIREAITWTVTNPLRRAIRKDVALVWASLRLSSWETRWCA